MALSAAGVAALVAVVVVGDTDVGSVVDEQLAISTATHIASPMHCVRETIIVAPPRFVAER
jgi:hypothetical protein